MKFVKYHLSIILPLFLLLFAVESFIVIKEIINSYEKKLSNDYSIVLVSKVPVDTNALIKTNSDIETINLVDINKTISQLKSSIGVKNMSKLKNSLPLFYSVKLKHLPSEDKLKSIKTKLSKIIGVQKVVTFKNSYSKLYNFLLFDKVLVLYFTIFISIIVLLLILKQAEIWIFEHSQRFEIMTILGAPFWMKSAMLFRVVIIDAIISSFLVIALFYYFSKDIRFLSFLNNMGITFPAIDFIHDCLVLLIFGIVVSIISVTFAIVKLNKE